MTTNTSRDYWISPNALHVELNALGNPDYIQASCVSGAQILVYVTGVIGYDAGHNYRRWSLQASPTVFGDHAVKYVYAAVPRNDETKPAMLVFPSEKIDIYGKNAGGTQLGSEDYYYIFLQGAITSSGANGTTQRDWQTRIDTGYLDSNAAIDAKNQESEWFSFSAVDQIVTIIKDITMKAGTKFLKLFAKDVEITSGGSLTFNGKTPITGPVSSDTPLESEAHIVTPKYLDEKALSKNRDDRTEYDLEMKNLKANGKADVFGNLTVGGGAVIGGDAVINGDTTMKGNAKIEKDLTIGTFNKGIEGAKVDFYGNAEFESIVARSFLEVPELRYNRTTITVGNKWQTQGAGVVEKVWQGVDAFGAGADTFTGVVKLKLEDAEPGAVAVNDKCQGIFHFLTNNDTDTSDPKNGNYHFAGFTTVYFLIKQIYTADTLPDNIKQTLEEGETIGDNQFFRYELRAKTCASLPAENRNRWTNASHPQPSMHFACYANETNSERQASRLTTTSYQLHLAGMTDWTYTQDNIRLIIGWLDGFTLLERVWNKTTKQYEQQAKELSGEGIAVGNMYMWGTIDQFDRAPSVVAQQLYYKSTQTNAAPDGMSVSSSYDVYYKNGWTKDPIKPSSSARYVWQQWLYTYSDGTYNVSDPSLSAIDNSILMTLLSRNLISVAISDWYDADAEDDISFDVTARITDGTAMLDITSATASCDADGVTMTYTSEVADDGKSVDFHVNLQGYVGVELNGVTPEDTFVRFTLGTAYGTASSTVAIAQNREGAAGADGQDGTDGESVVSVQLSTPVVAISTTEGSVSTGVADRDIYVSMYNGSTPMDCIVSTDWNQAMPFNVSVSGSVVKISAVAGTAWTSDTMLTIMASHITDTDEIVRTAQLNVVGSAQGQMVTGPQGASISRVEEAYKATATETAPAYNDTGWTTSHIVPTAALPYVWNREIVYIKEQGSPETPISTDVHLCCVFSDGILTHTSEYAATKSRTSNPTSWTTLDAAMTKFSATYRYLWNKEGTTYKDTSKDTTAVRLIAVWGSQGESNFTLDLDNEMTSAGTDKDGLLSDAKSITLALNAYYGRTDKTSECAISVVNEASLPTGISVDLTTKSAPVVTIAAGTTLADTTEITFQAVHSTYGTRTAVFTLCAAKAGNEGADAELYELLPSVTSVVFTRAQDGTTLTPTSRKLTLSILHTKGSEQTVKSISSSGLTVRYSTSSTPANATAGSAFPETGVTIKSSTEKSALYIAAFNALGKLVDRETIPFLKDGQKGSSGSTPEIGENGNWFVDGEDTGFSSRGNNGYSPQKGANGNWWAWSTSANAYVDTGIPMQGASAHSPYVGTNGNWYVYDDSQGRYVDSGQTSRGDDGHTPYIGDDGFWYEYDADSGEYRKTDITSRGADGDSAIYMHLSTPVVAVPTEDGAIATGAMPRTVNVALYNGSQPLDIQSLTTDWTSYMPFALSTEGSNIMLTFTAGRQWTDTMLTLTTTAVVGTETITRSMQLNVVGSAQGQTVTGPQGASISRIVEAYKSTASSNAPSASSSGWTSLHIAPTADLPYVWNREKIYVLDPTTNTESVVSTDVHLCCTFSDGIVSHTSTYCVTDIAAQPTSGWTTLDAAMQTFSADHRYMWNKETVVYKSGEENTNTRLIAVWGEKGEPGQKGDKGDTGQAAVYMQLSTPVVAISTTEGSVSTGVADRDIYVSMYNGSTPMDCIVSTDWNQAMPFNVSVSGSVVKISAVAGTAWTSDTMLTIMASHITDTDEIVRTAQLNVVGSAQGQTVTGPQGSSISKVEEYFLATAVNTAPSATDGGWQTDHIEPTAAKQYVWNKEVIYIVDGVTQVESVLNTDVHLCCTFADGLLEHTSSYAVTDDKNTPSRSSWGTLDAAMAIFSVDHRFLWNREIAKYKDSSKNTSAIRLIAVWGEKGDTPTIDAETGNWIINGEVTEFSSVGDDGHSPYVSENTGTWWEYDPDLPESQWTAGEQDGYHDTGIKAEGEDGADAVSVNVSNTAFTAKKSDTAQDFIVYVRVNRGNTALQCKNVSTVTEGFVCTALGDSTIVEGLKWSWKIEDNLTTFCYRLRVKAGAVVNESDIPFIVTVDEKQYKYNISVNTVSDGSKGDKGDKGEPGTGIEIKGSAVKYYDSYGEYFADTEKTSGTYLVNGRQHPLLPQSMNGACVYLYSTDTDETVISESSVNDTYTCDDGHLYVAVTDVETDPQPTDTYWRDCGVTRGQDAIVYTLDMPMVILEGTTAFDITVVKTQGDTITRMTYEQATADGITLEGAQVQWNATQQRFYMSGGSVKDATYTVTLLKNGYQIQQYTVQCIGSGAKGYDGCIVRRSEWQTGKRYHYDADLTPQEAFIKYGDSQRYIDEVSVTNLATNEATWYIAREAHNDYDSSDTNKPTGNGNDYWQKLNNVQPLRTSFADIAQAFIQFLQVNQIVLTDGTNPYGAFGKNASGYPLWFGATDVDNAVFKVNEQGHLYSQKFITQGSNVHVEIENGVAKFFGIQQTPNIVLGSDTNGCAVLNFYDQFGNYLYNLGPEGIQYTKTQELSLIYHKAKEYGGEAYRQGMNFDDFIQRNYDNIRNLNVGTGIIYQVKMKIVAGAYSPLAAEDAVPVPYVYDDGSGNGTTTVNIGGYISSQYAAHFDGAFLAGKVIVDTQMISGHIIVGEWRTYQGSVPDDYLQHPLAYPDYLDDDFAAGVRYRPVKAILNGQAVVSTNIYFANT